jgi:poly(A) polymerase
MTEHQISLPAETDAERVADRIAARLRDAGHQAFFVGGSVRDRILGKSPHEVDVATDATPDQVQALFPRTVAVGAAFGVIVVVDDEINTEVATFRTDGGYQDGRHPDAVVFSDPEHDAERRDFTFNALFYDPTREVLIDYVNGLEDLKAGIVRAIGEPERRFAEDYLRMLRAVHFTARFDFQLDDATADAIRQHAKHITAISPERIGAELTKMLTGPNAHVAFRLMDELELLPEILPEISAMKGVEQPKQYHPEGDVFVHTLLLLEKLDNPPPALGWAALLHDVGKPPTFTINDRGYEAFPSHASVGAKMTEEILRRFRFSNAHIDAVREMVYYHMSFADVKNMRQSTLRRMLARPTIEEELELHRIDCLSSFGKLDHYHFVKDAREAFANEPVLPDPLVTGKDVIALGIQPGPEIGKFLAVIRDQQLEGQLNSREEALAALAKLV